MGTYTFVLPAGSTLTDISLPEQTGEEFEGWYTDEDCTIPAVLNTAVNSNLTLYADFTDTTGTSTFTEALERGDSILPISNLADFTAFVARADEVTADQRVELQNDLPLGGGSFSSIANFKGDFDGQNYTISNGAFTAVDNNAGMFATLGAGQVVANLKLDEITVANATNSGILAGSINGGEGNRPLIQNIQVTNSNVTGRNAGGIAGYAFLTDIKYCSTKSGVVSGNINAGGIAGISYSNITNCCSTIEATAWPIFGDAGGIVGKNLEASHIEYCWSVMSEMSGDQQQGGTTANIFGNVSEDTFSFDFPVYFDTSIWNLQDGLATTFYQDAVTYHFTEVA